jgi:hypothetical protein
MACRMLCFHKRLPNTNTAHSRYLHCMRSAHIQFSSSLLCICSATLLTLARICHPVGALQYMFAAIYHFYIPVLVYSPSPCPVLHHNVCSDTFNIGILCCAHTANYHIATVDSVNGAMLENSTTLRMNTVQQQLACHTMNAVC